MQGHKEVRPGFFVGARFHRWTILDREPIDLGYKKWKVWCECDCGTVRAVQTGSLKNGSSKSCGCRRDNVPSTASDDIDAEVKEAGLVRIANALAQSQLCFQQNKLFPDCSEKYCLTFDFCVKDAKDRIVGVIDYRGNMHYSSRGTDWNIPDRLLRLRKHDYIKQLYCEERGIPFLIIPYTISNIEEFLFSSDFWAIVSKNLND